MGEIVKAIVDQIARTNEWVVLGVFILYVLYRLVDEYKDFRMLKIIQDTLMSLLQNIDRNLSRLTARLEGFIMGRGP